MLTISEILRVVAGECENSCTDVQSSVTYFTRYFKHQFYVDDLTALLSCIDFDALRQNSEVVYKMSEIK